MIGYEYEYRLYKRRSPSGNIKRLDGYDAKEGIARIHAKVLLMRRRDGNFL